MHVGVPMDHWIVPQEERPSLTRRLKDHERAMQADGVDYELAYYSPESGLAEFAERLRARRWDGVIVGAGIVGTPQLAHFMEQIVDVARSAAPQAKIMFIHGVEDVRPALRRWFPAV